jgi:hypothetical protein
MAGATGTAVLAGGAGSGISAVHDPTAPRRAGCTAWVERLPLRPDPTDEAAQRRCVNAPEPAAMGPA